MSLAARSWNRRQALEKEVKDLYAKITIGSSGACTLTTGYGCASIVKNGTGDYTLTLSDKYTSLKFFAGTLIKSSAEDINVQMYSEGVASDKTIRFLTLTGASATNPSSGAVLLLKIEVKNTSAV
jgi:hypothetical protein